MSEPDLERGLSLEVVTPRKQTISRGDDAGEEGGIPYAFGAFSIPLYGYHDLPTFLQGNPYITHGYRVNLDTEMCVKRSVNLTSMLAVSCKPAWLAVLRRINTMWVWFIIVFRCTCS